MTFRLRAQVKDYDWGKLGSNSAVARLAKASDGEFRVDETKPYAELWFGTHVSGPSDVCVDGVWMPLKELLQQRPGQFLCECGGVRVRVLIVENQAMCDGVICRTC
jgi:mannose-6-phosphate isomerase class I